MIYAWRLDRKIHLMAQAAQINCLLKKQKTEDPGGNQSMAFIFKLRSSIARISKAGLLVALIVASFAVSATSRQQQSAPDPKKPMQGGPRNLTVDDLFEIKRVQDAQLSPEGKWVAYTISAMSLKDDKAETQVWMIPTVGGEAIPMTAKGSTASRLSISWLTAIRRAWNVRVAG